MAPATMRFMEKLHKKLSRKTTPKIEVINSSSVDEDFKIPVSSMKPSPYKNMSALSNRMSRCMNFKDSKMFLNQP